MSTGATRAGTGDGPVSTPVDGVSGRVEEQRVNAKPAKTSVAAAIALALGVAALLCVLTVILSPVGLVLGVLGIIAGIVGIKAAKKVGITGGGVAKTGLVLSVLAVIAAIVFAVGTVTFLNNQGAVDRLEQQVQNLRDKLPTQVDVPTP